VLARVTRSAAPAAVHANRWPTSMEARRAAHRLAALGSPACSVLAASRTEIAPSLLETVILGDASPNVSMDRSLGGYVNSLTRGEGGVGDFAPAAVDVRACPRFLISTISDDSGL
jgi:hypothetical protein